MRSPLVHRTTLKELENQFRKFDADGDGSITEE
uniref:EF-hand domain-containing protein n=1 Tax=Heterorhabditis bacteriophora TaxID=37862 RepID=A0A1I7XDP9_HETBA